MTEKANETQYSHILRAVAETPWAILPSKFAVIADLLGRRARGDRVSLEEIQASMGQARDPRQALDDPMVAVLPLFGTIFPRANMMSEMSGGTSLAMWIQDLRAAVNSPMVSSIVIDVDSPGGSVEMLPEAAAEIYAARAIKPVIAVADTLAASAAYWLASQAEEFVVSPSASVGSIGIFAAHEDFSERDANAGVKTTLISAGKYKTEGNPFEPLTDEARETMQERVDDYYEMFIADVARGRGVSVEKVRAGFGEGRLVLAGKAVTMGMADRVGTFGEALGSAVREASVTASGFQVPVVTGSASAPVWADGTATGDGTGEALPLISAALLAEEEMPPPEETEAPVEDIVQELEEEEVVEPEMSPEAARAKHVQRRHALRRADLR
jgi:signal peptide peptidase SppA